jgi:hypothetical protein
MAAIVFPMGERLSSPTGEFDYSPAGNPIGWMMTVHDARRARLLMLVQQHAGSMANLCEALGFARSDTARLTRIANANLRHEREGKPYVMGDELARQIEAKLNLERGWMDTPPGYADPSDSRITKALRLMEAMPEWQRDQAVKILDTLAQPVTKSGNGTNGTTG